MSKRMKAGFYFEVLWHYMFKVSSI